MEKIRKIQCTDFLLNSKNSIWATLQDSPSPTTKKKLKKIKKKQKNLFSFKLLYVVVNLYKKPHFGPRLAQKLQKYLFLRNPFLQFYTFMPLQIHAKNQKSPMH